MTDNDLMKDQWNKFVADNIPFEGSVASDDANYMAHTIDDLFARLESQDSLLAEQLLRINALYDGAESTPALVKIARLEAKIESQQKLINEVVGWHTDKKGADYNECDTAPCAWCEEAKALTKEPA